MPDRGVLLLDPCAGVHMLFPGVSVLADATLERGVLSLLFL